MLSKFSVTNYRGFSKRIELDLSRPSGYDFNKTAVKDGVVKNGIIYGPNGSGKTNIGLAIFDIANHLSHKWKKPDYYLNFVSAVNYLRPVEFEYCFKFGSRCLKYSYAKTAKDGQIIMVKERLEDQGGVLFNKDVEGLTIAEEFSISSDAKQNLMDGANTISLINFILASAPLGKDHILIKLRDFVENMLFFRSLDNREFIGYREGSSNIEEYIISNKYVKDFGLFLEETSNQKYEFAEPALGEKNLYCLMNGVKVPFQLVASTGTLNLELQYFWLKEMVNASFVFIDEFDAFYHHELSYAICRRLFVGDRQTFMTTHDTYLLTNDLLRPDCFFIIRDNKIDAICNMTEKELRFGHNLEKLYRGGTFGK
jgi:AAA15 family ATPase/GTPase